MYFEQHEYQRAVEHHERLLVEARILRLIRAAQGQAHPQPLRPQRQPTSLLARVTALLRTSGSARA
ncbi:MAG TPA: hypothetical protein VNL77_23150 [Roseiflexaceae bacterium]|nr:hypothetical protein [Roseiflexaceae bacterium]